MHFRRGTLGTEAGRIKTEKDRWVRGGSWDLGRRAGRPQRLTSVFRPGANWRFRPLAEIPKVRLLAS
jgi:hypothetical protein